MENTSRQVPTIYEQPVRNFTGRKLEGALEKVEYISQSHIRLWYNVQNDSYDLHHHAAMEIVYCLENQYSVKVGEKDYLLNAGDFLFIPPHILHELHPVDGGARYICLIDVDPVRAFQDFQVMAPMFQQGFLLSRKTLPGVYDRIKELFRDMSEVYFSNRMLWESTAYIRILEILTCLGREYFRNQVHAKGQSEHGSRDDYETIASLLKYIENHYAEDISLEQAADLSGFSKYYFSRLFKQITNDTFCDYLAHRRISAAQAMLSSDLPITDIAFRTGFNNLTTFNRSFRKHTGCSPSEYRSRIRVEHFGEIIQ